MVRWALIECERSKPKSEFALELSRALAGKGLRVGGFAQPERRDERGEKGYELVRLSTGEREELARGGVAARPGEEAVCDFAFRQGAFDLARRWIEADAGADVLILDGIGKLEAAGRGHAASLRRALELSPPARVVVAARPSQLFYLVERFGLEEPIASLRLPAAEGERADFARALARAG
jgi:nucleoside-triphosphatase THEP1